MEEGGCRSTYIGYVTTHHSGWLPGSRDIVVSLLYTRRSSFHTTTMSVLFFAILFSFTYMSRLKSEILKFPIYYLVFF